MMIEGKGLYIWKINRCEGGNPTAIVQRARDAGLSHVLIKVADGPDAYNGDQVGPLVQALKAAGLQAWGWQYVYGDQPGQEAEIAVQRVSLFGLDGFVVNAEVQYKNKPVAASTYIEALTARLPGVPLALSSFRYPTYHADFPWTEFLSRCTFNMPQVYWVEATNPSQQLDQCIAQFQAIYPVLPVLPTGAAYEEGGWRPKSTEIVQFLSHAREIGIPAVSFWSWDYAGSSQGSDLWQAIASFDWPVGVPPVQAQKDASQTLFDALNQGNIDGILALYQPDAVLVTSRQTYQGQDALHAYYANLLANALPGGQFSMVLLPSLDDITRQMTWKAASSINGQAVTDGFDTIRLRDGLIQYHSAIYHLG